MYKAVMGQNKPTIFTKTSGGSKPPVQPITSSNAYFTYFSQRVSEQTNETWVKLYLPLLKEMADGYVRLPGSGKTRKAMNHEIALVGVPLTMRG